MIFFVTQMAFDVKELIRVSDVFYRRRKLVSECIALPLQNYYLDKIRQFATVVKPLPKPTQPESMSSIPDIHLISEWNQYYRDLAEYTVRQRKIYHRRVNRARYVNAYQYVLQQAINLGDTAQFLEEKLPKEGEVRRTKEGREYYVDHKTRQTSWNIPLARF